MTGHSNLYSFLYVFRINHQKRPLALSSNISRIRQSFLPSQLSLWSELPPPLAWIVPLFTLALLWSIINTVTLVIFSTCKSGHVAYLSKSSNDAPFHRVKAESFTTAYQDFCDPVLSPWLNLCYSLHFPLHSSLLPWKSQAHSYGAFLFCSKSRNRLPSPLTNFTQRSPCQWGITQFWKLKIKMNPSS